MDELFSMSLDDAVVILSNSDESGVSKRGEIRASVEDALQKRLSNEKNVFQRRIGLPA